VDKVGRERTGKDTPLNMLQLFCQQPRQWKAYAAKALSDRLSARAVCDSSGGWGDRLTGFLASKSVEDITVIEPRWAACDAFERQLEDAGVSKNLTVLHGPAEMMMADVAGDIDLFLTSPPYLPSERYPGHDGGHGREMEERWKLRVERGCHLEGWVAEGWENKSWSCGAAPVALNTYRGERSSATDRVKLQDRSSRRIAPAVKHRGN
jgi:hypothetical protein